MGETARLRAKFCVPLLLALVWVGAPAAARGEAAPVTIGAPLPAPEVIVSMPGSINGYGVSSDGGDGVWFNDVEEENGRHASYLTHYSPELLTIKQVPLAPLPPGQNGQDSVWGIAPGLHGEELFLEWEPNTLAQITTKAKRKAVSLPEQYGDPQELVVSGDGTIWYLSRLHGCQLVHMTVKAKVLSSVSCGGDSISLAVGPDGNIWVAAYTGDDVEEVSASTGTVIARYNLPLPTGITTLGQDIYVAEDEPGAIAKIAPDGTVTTYALPAGRTLEWITTGPDGAVWFDENIGPNGHSAGLGRLSPGGELREVEAEVWRLAATSDAIYSVGVHEGVRVLYREPLSNFSPASTRYVALGDSYSSGEGNPPFEPGSDQEEPPDLCHRSQAAYGPQLSLRLGLGPLQFRACSGAVTADIFDTSAQYPEEPAQSSWLDLSTRVVTLTIGGNDAGFASLLNHCVDLPVLHPGYACSTNRGLADETDARLAALGGGRYATSPAGTSIHSIVSVLGKLHEKAPGARILIGLYPRPFGEDRSRYVTDSRAPSGAACEVGAGLRVDYKDALWLDGLGKELNSVITKGAKTAKTASGGGVPVSVAKPTNFNGHGFCDQQTTWLNPVKLKLGQEQEVQPETSSFHPTAAGQTQGYEAAFAKALE